MVSRQVSSVVLVGILLLGSSGLALAQPRGGSRPQPQATQPAPVQPDRDRTRDQDRDRVPDQDRLRDRDRDRLLDLDGDGVPDRDRDRDRDRDYLNSASSLVASGLLTEQERSQFRLQMQQASSDADRARIRAEHRQQIRERAEQIGISLGPDGVQSQGRHRYMLSQMLTDQERLRFHEQMRQATSRQERDRLREELQERLQERLRQSMQDGQ
ncbi:hypothetical protein Q0812_08670 [Brevundimonas sp. 2R-24]|uniref:Uncharacterized protein n=1 Tax=Peiella sedimenti TaxID=3061083 RepID=A0ABT8SLR3_9CAUL|nr:hypothetical protein [Caulobacteraceae bacterium XZ-24]